MVFPLSATRLVAMARVAVTGEGGSIEKNPSEQMAACNCARVTGFYNFDMRIVLRYDCNPGGGLVGLVVVLERDVMLAMADGPSCRCVCLGLHFAVFGCTNCTASC